MDDKTTKGFKVQLPTPSSEDKTVVVYCSGYNVQETTEQFLRNGLKLKSFDRIAVPGGPEFFLAMRHFPKLQWSGNRWTSFLMKSHGLQRVICISHSGCSWYNNGIIGLLKLVNYDVKQKQIEDLREIRSSLSKMFPGIRIETFFEERKDDGSEFIEIQ